VGRAAPPAGLGVELCAESKRVNRGIGVRCAMCGVHVRGPTNTRSHCASMYRGHQTREYVQRPSRLNTNYSQQALALPPPPHPAARLTQSRAHLPPPPRRPNPRRRRPAQATLRTPPRYCCPYPCPYCTLPPSARANPPSLLLPLPVSLLYTHPLVAPPRTRRSRNSASLSPAPRSPSPRRAPPARGTRRVRLVRGEGRGVSD